jgi:hypothetical protein
VPVKQCLAFTLYSAQTSYIQGHRWSTKSMLSTLPQLPAPLTTGVAILLHCVQDEFGIDGSCALSLLQDIGESHLGASPMATASHYTSNSAAAAVSEPAVLRSQQRTSSTTTDRHRDRSNTREQIAIPSNTSSIWHTANSDITASTAHHRTVLSPAASAAR